MERNIGESGRGWERVSGWRGAKEGGRGDDLRDALFIGCEKIRYDPICGPPILTNRRRNLRENPLSCRKLVLEFSRNLEYKGCRASPRASFPRKLATANRSCNCADVLSNLPVSPPRLLSSVHMGFASSEYLKRYDLHAVRRCKYGRQACCVTPRRSKWGIGRN